MSDGCDLRRTVCLEDADLKSGSPEGPLSGFEYDIYLNLYMHLSIFCVTCVHILCYSFFRTVYIVMDANI